MTNQKKNIVFQSTIIEIKPELHKYKEHPFFVNKLAIAKEIMEKTGLPSESLIEEARLASLAARKSNSLSDTPKPIATKTSTSNKPRRKISKKKAISV
jgi:hypothetical protein